MTCWQSWKRNRTKNQARTVCSEMSAQHLIITAFPKGMYLSESLKKHRWSRTSIRGRQIPSENARSRDPKSSRGKTSFDKLSIKQSDRDHRNYEVATTTSRKRKRWKPPNLDRFVYFFFAELKKGGDQCSNHGNKRPVRG